MSLLAFLRRSAAMARAVAGTKPPSSPSSSSISDSSMALASPSSSSAALSNLIASAPSSSSSSSHVHVVMGNRAGDADSIVSAVVFAYLLQQGYHGLRRPKSHHSLTPSIAASSCSSFPSSSFAVPLCNFDRRDIGLRKETLELFANATGIAADDLTPSLLFDGELDLAGLHAQGRLMLTLVDHNALDVDQTFLAGSVVRIIDHHKDQGLYRGIAAADGGSGDVDGGGGDGDDAGVPPPSSPSSYSWWRNSVSDPRREILFNVKEGKGGVGSTCTLIARRALKRVQRMNESEKEKEKERESEERGCRGRGCGKETTAAANEEGGREGRRSGAHVDQRVMEKLQLQQRGDGDGVGQGEGEGEVYIIPNMNPDGGFRGHLRTNAVGANLNREWHPSTLPDGGGIYDAPTLDRSPEVFHTLREMKRRGQEPSIHLDIHGDEEIGDIFYAGAQGVDAWQKSEDRHEALLQLLAEATLRAAPDFQVGRGYENDELGKANLAIGSNTVAQVFDCLSVTVEMPFKDTETTGTECPLTGWDGSRSAQFGASSLQAIYEMLPVLPSSSSSPKKGGGGGGEVKGAEEGSSSSSASSSSSSSSSSSIPKRVVDGKAMLADAIERVRKEGYVKWRSAAPPAKL